MDLIKRIDDLIKKFANSDVEADKEVLNGWKKETQDLLILKKGEDLAVINEIKSRFRDNIREINELLLTADSGKLTDFRRDLLLEKKKMFVNFVDIFEDIKPRLDEMERQVAEQENYFEKNKENWSL